MKHLSAPYRLLVVEDDPITQESVLALLETEGFQTCCAGTGSEALLILEKLRVDLVLLDMHLPDIFGIELFRRIQARHRQLPALFLTANDRESDIVKGLEMGAEDYILKPFRPSELMVRIRRILTRQSGTEPVRQANRLDLLEFENLKLYFDLHRVYLSSTEVPLTRAEFDILCLLALQPQRVFTRDQILDQVWPCGSGVTDRVIDTHIGRIRQKLNQIQAGSGHYLLTVRGVGYRFNSHLHSIEQAAE